MALHDSTALTLESEGAAESLPDPALHNGRMHVIANTGLAAATWTSVGATPFVVDGVNVASLVIPRGVLRILQSDGVRWVVAPSATRRVFAGTAVTDGGGNATFTFTPGFSVTPVAVAQVGPSGDTALVEARVTTLTTGTCIVNVRRSPSVVILGISVLQVPANAPGVTVQLVAIEPGQGV